MAKRGMFTLSAALILVGCAGATEAAEPSNDLATDDVPVIDDMSLDDRQRLPSGAYCMARRASGDGVVFAATDFGLVKLDGSLIELELGDQFHSSMRLHGREQDIVVRFEPRTGSVTPRTGSVTLSEEEEATTEPMTMIVMAGNVSSSLPVLRTCGA